MPYPSKRKKELRNAWESKHLKLEAHESEKQGGGEENSGRVIPTGTGDYPSGRDDGEEGLIDQSPSGDCDTECEWKWVSKSVN